MHKLTQTIITTVIITLTTSALGDSIRLHDQVGVEHERVLLRDVAELEGPRAEQLGEIVVALLRPNQTQFKLRLDNLRRTLDDDGRANWARLTLKGFSICQVERIAPEPPPTVHADESAPLIANVEQDMSLNSPMTLRDWVIDQLEQHVGVPRSDLRITFTRHDRDVLSGSVWDSRLVFEPRSSARLGRIPIIVRQYRGQELAQTFRLTVDVALRTTAVLVRRNISRGQTLAPGDLQVQQVFLTRDRGQPVTDVSDVVGQVAAKMMREGTIVYPEHIKSPRMVRRGQIITVRCIFGGLEVKTIARATEDGAVGDIIQVRNERSRDSYPVKVTAMRQAVALLGEPGHLAEGDLR